MEINAIIIWIFKSIIQQTETKRDVHRKTEDIMYTSNY
jgi:hypothetical protein